MFAGSSGDASMMLDSAGAAGPSPVQALGFALAGCMAIDLIHILTKGRHPLRGLTSRLVANRAPEEPRRFLDVALHFTVDGDVPPEAVDRAIALSREKYCSVWHSMARDITFTVTWAGREASD